MTWEKLNTRHIHSVKYYPSKKILKAYLKTGHFETYDQIPEARYRELIAGTHPHDIDMFFSNMIKPTVVSTRMTLNARMRRIAGFLAIAVLVTAFLVLLGLWNAGILDYWFADLFFQPYPAG